MAKVKVNITLTDPVIFAEKKQDLHLSSRVLNIVCVQET